MKKLLYILPLLWVSCTPDPIPITLDEMESRPVVWSQAIPGSTTLIYFSRTFSALEFQEGDSTSTEDLLQQFLVSDALITLSNGADTDTLTQIVDGLFAGFDMELIPGQSYTLKALDLSNNQSIESTTQVYAAVPIDTVTWSHLDSSTYRVRVGFQDPPGSNWYAVHFYTQYADPLMLDNPFEAENVVETALLSDLELNTGLVEIERELEFVESDTIYVSLNNISQEFYQYLSQRQRGGNIYNQLVQEPINYVSNVQHGYGFFSLHFPTVRQVILTE